METENIKIIDLAPENIAQYGVCGYKDINKHLELQRKKSKKRVDKITDVIYNYIVK